MNVKFTRETLDALRAIGFADRTEPAIDSLLAAKGHIDNLAEESMPWSLEYAWYVALADKIDSAIGELKDLNYDIMELGE